MAIAKLSIDIEARLANFERDLGKISTAAESTANRIKTSFAGVGAIVGSAFGALLAAGAAVPASEALPRYIRDKVAKTTAERAALRAATEGTP